MKLPVAREGYPFIGVPAAAAALLLIAGHHAAGSVLALLAVACAVFFRDPEREVPSDPLAIVSPADGKVIALGRSDEDACISIFLSIFDVHVNRSPTSAEVGPVVHARGRFLAAFDPRAPEVNEQTTIPLRCDAGLVIVKQIAGLIARRIVCDVREGDRLRAGQRLGMIRFGSRTELILPPNAVPLVRVGDRVRGGATIVARWQGPGEGRDTR